MAALHFIGLYLIITNVISLDSDCSFGNWVNYNGECKFDCNSAGNYRSPSNLTYDLIYKQCENIRIAHKDGVCDSMDDLIYKPGSCGCPYCQCSNISSDYYTEVLSWEPSKICSKCICSDVHSSWNMDGTKIYDCDGPYSPRPIIEVDSNTEDSQWDFYSCPPNICYATTWTGGQSIKYAGDQWWNDNNDPSQTCTTFCYCPFEGEVICATGYDNIVGDDAELFRQFQEDCRWNVYACYDMETRSYDTSRFLDTYTGRDCTTSWTDECPVCKCPDGMVDGDEFYHEYLYSQDSTMAKCAQCWCNDDGNGNLIATCSSTTDQYEIGTKSCPVQHETYSCHKQASVTGALIDLTPTSCTAEDSILFSIGDYGNYCQWTYNLDSNNNDPYKWDCANSMICEAFANDKCIFVDQFVQQYDCDGVANTYSSRSYMKCCDITTNNENCNYQTVSVNDECVEDEEYNNLLQEYASCYYGIDSKLKEWECDLDVTELTCDGLEAYFSATNDCMCPYYSDIYGRVSSSTQSKMQTDLDKYLTKYSEYNDALGCDIMITCDLSSGSSSSSSSGTTASPDATSSVDTTSEPGGSSNGCESCDMRFVNDALMFIAVIWSVSLW